MSLRNNFEIKYLSVNDTSSTEKKLPILENLDFSTSYNLVTDSFNLSPIQMTTGTRLFDNKFNVQFNATFDPYATDNSGRRYNSYLFHHNGHLARLTSASLSMGTSFSSSQGQKTNTDNQSPGNIQQNPTATTNNSKGPYLNKSEDVNFDIPWDVTINFNFGYQLNLLKAIYNKGMTFSGDLSITKKWKIGLSSGYDFVSKQITYTNININRDLHCWQMTFNWTPFGYMARYSFTISARASILRDLKYTKQSDYREKF